jgi:hypothetical protein
MIRQAGPACTKTDFGSWAVDLQAPVLSKTEQRKTEDEMQGRIDIWQCVCCVAAFLAPVWMVAIAEIIRLLLHHGGMENIPDTYPDAPRSLFRD